MVKTTKNLGGAPEGNQNAAKGKRWSQAIDRALSKRSPSDRTKALDELAEKLLKAADAGESWALKELGDRIEGKPAQSHIIGGDEENPVEIVTTIEIVPLADEED